MLQLLVEIALSAVGVYLALGLFFAIAFAFKGANGVDPSARLGTFGFRLLIIPASMVLWPMLLRRWLSGTGPPEEHNSHRDLSHRGVQ